MYCELFYVYISAFYYSAWEDKDSSNVDSLKYVSGWMAYAASQVCVCVCVCARACVRVCAFMCKFRRAFFYSETFLFNRLESRMHFIACIPSIWLLEHSLTGQYALCVFNKPAH